MSAGNPASRATVQSDAELADLVEQLIGELWWRVNSELPSGLSRTSASILKSLREHGAQRVTALAAREHVAQPTMSVIIKRLGARELVERHVDPDDKRATLVAITPLGLDALNQRAQLRSRWFASRLAGLEGEERRAVAAAVAKLVETFA